MIVEAEKRGEIAPGDVLIEATSGNTGIALAMIAALKGYQMKLLMPDNMSQERRAAMRAYGAELILVTKEQGMEGARDLAAEMAQRGEGTLLDQFNNPDNPYAHYTTTGPEIWQQTDGRISHFVSSMGTTGTITGVSRFLREQHKPVSIVGLQPEEGSSIPGIRRWPAEYMPGIFNASLVDVVMDIHQQDAENTMRMLATREGIFLRRKLRRCGSGRAAYCPGKSRGGSGGDRLRSRRSLSLYRRVWRRALCPGRGYLNRRLVQQIGAVGVINAAEPAIVLQLKNVGRAARDLR
nr:cysteine synthase B [Raoultella sp. NCTC 9187]